MFLSRRAIVILLFAIIAGIAPMTSSSASEGTSSEAAADPYVCPPCGAAHDAKVFDKPGTCPECGMKLVKKSSIRERYNLGILLFDGVQIIDYTGPYEVFGQGGIFDVYTVSETGESLTTAMGMRVIPSHSFENSPRPDILLVPGGDVHGPLESERTISWIRDVEKDATYVMSVCNGAFILAKAGLLDGKSATTFYGMIDDLEEAAPKTKVVRDQRWVDNGKVITTAGLSSGIDGSLHLIAKIRGLARAKAVALHMEYDWDPDSTYARAAFADQRFPDIQPPEGAQLTLVSTEGTRDEWTLRYEVRGFGSSARLVEYLKSQVNGENRWKALNGTAAATGNAGTWTSVDETGATWKFLADVRGGVTDGEPSIVTLRIEKSTAGQANARP